MLRVVTDLRPRSRPVRLDQQGIARMRNTAIFSELSNKDLRIIADHSVLLTYHTNEGIFDIGMECNAMYMIHRGEVAIQKGDEAGVRSDLAHFVAGEPFADTELFQRRRHSAAAIACKDNTRLLRFPASDEAAVDIIEHHPDILARIMRRLVVLLAGRIRSTNRLISENSRWIQELRRQVLVDKLTGLYNNRYLKEDYRRLFNNRQRPVCMLMVKPDNFKQINDNYGHEVGDSVLRLFAETFRRTVASDKERIAMRYRSNEFTVILAGADSAVGEQVASELHAAIAAVDISHLIKDTEVTVPFSIGVAAFPKDANNGDRLVTLANRTLYEARDAGGNRILVAHRKQRAQ